MSSRLLHVGFVFLLLSKAIYAFGSEPSQEQLSGVVARSNDEFVLLGFLQWKDQLSVLAEDNSVSHVESTDNGLYLKLKLIEDGLLIRRRIEKPVDWEALYDQASQYTESDPLQWYLVYYHGLHLFASGQLKAAEILLKRAYDIALVHRSLGYERSSLLALYEVNMCANQSSEAVHYFRLFYELTTRNNQKDSLHLKSDAIAATENGTKVGLYQRWWLLILVVTLVFFTWYGWSKYRLILVSVQRLSNEKFTSFQFPQATNLQKKFEIPLIEDVLTDEEILVDEQKVELLAELRSKKILTEEDWFVFQRLFVQVHPDFLVHLRFRHKQITPSEEKLACLIRLHFSTKEIARLLAVSTHAVNVGRYRLKKRFLLEGNLRLEEYLMGF